MSDNLRSNSFLRILMIAPQFFPIVGGYERAAERLSVSLIAKGHIVEVVTERRDNKWEKKELISGILVHRLNCIYRKRMHIISSLMFFALFLLRKGHHYDVWHIHQYGVHAVLAVILGRLMGVPTILKITNSDADGVNGTMSNIPLGRKLTDVNMCVAISRETYQEALLGGFVREKLTTISNGVNSDTFCPINEHNKLEIRANLGINASGVVLSVGRLSRQKNFDGLIHAWSQALPSLPKNWQLFVIGDGPMKEQLTRLSQSLGVSDTVYFVGKKDNIHEWLGIADLFVIASHHEGLSNALLEAMSCGLPSISTHVSGATELLSETGAGIVVRNSGKELSEAITYLANNPQTRKIMGNNARETIEQNYSIDMVATKYDTLYKKMLNIALY